MPTIAATSTVSLSRDASAARITALRLAGPSGTRGSSGEVGSRYPNPSPCIHSARGICLKCASATRSIMSADSGAPPSEWHSLPKWLAMVRSRQHTTHTSPPCVEHEYRLPSLPVTHLTPNRRRLVGFSAYCWPSTSTLWREAVNAPPFAQWTRHHACPSIQRRPRH
eukprot:3689764-Prymnesium_polylepis.1